MPRGVSKSAGDLVGVFDAKTIGQERDSQN